MLFAQDTSGTFLVDSKVGKLFSGDFTGRERLIHMIKKINIIGVLSLICLLFGTVSAGADELGYQSQGQKLSNTPAYDWWYGCSPTAAGMMLGYYDRNGYNGLTYDNLVPGGTAESQTFTGPTTGWNSLINNVIASSGHVNDFYAGGNNAGNDDKKTTRKFDSLADFMGTSQDSVRNLNGWTYFYYWSDGRPFTAADAKRYGVWNKDGMYGIWEYLVYAGYIIDTNKIYTQETDNQVPGGFSFLDYKSEIDAGRVVMIQVDGHSMLGYGYDDNNIINVYDTWSSGDNTMTWGGEYAGMDLWGVTVLELSGGNSTPNNDGYTPSSPAGTPVPEPATFLFLFTGMISLMAVRRFC